MHCVTPPVLLAPLRAGLLFRKLVPSESPKLSLLNLLASDKCLPFLRLYMWPEISKTCAFHFITSTMWPNFCLTQGLSLSFWMLSWRVQVSWFTLSVSYYHHFEFSPIVWYAIFLFYNLLLSIFMVPFVHQCIMALGLIMSRDGPVTQKIFRTFFTSHMRKCGR